MTQAFNLALLANKVNSSGQLNADTGLYNSPVPSGSVFLLYQSAAPTGWTQVTSLNDYALRIVSGTGGTTGGTTAFSTVFANQAATISATTLSTSQIPSHSHTVPFVGNPLVGSPLIGADCTTTYIASTSSGLEGGGTSHTHTGSTITLNVRYTNIILCSKN